MITHTHAAGDAVKKKENSLIDWARHRRAQRALLESPLIPFDQAMLWMYLHSLQGQKDHAFPSLTILAKRIGSKGRALRLIDGLLKALPEVFEVKRSGGRRRTSYKCKDFPQWPLTLIERLEAAKPKNPRKRTVVDAHQENIARIANCPKIEPQGSIPVVPKWDHYMESMEVINSKSTIEAVNTPNESTLKFACASCGKHSPGGFDYKGIWVCQKDSECHQQAWEAAGLF